MMTQSNNGLQPRVILREVAYYDEMQDQETATFLRRMN